MLLKSGPSDLKGMSEGNQGFKNWKYHFRREQTDRKPSNLAPNLAIEAVVFLHVEVERSPYAETHCH